MLKNLSLAPLVLLAACGPDAMPTSAEDTVTYALERFDQEESPAVVWDLLPPSYQKEVNRWCRQFGEKLPGKAYDKLFLALQKTGVLLKTKGEYLLAFGPFRMMMQLARNTDEDEILAMLTALGNIPILLSQSEIASLDQLKRIDFGAFLSGTGARIWKQCSRAYKITGKSVGSVFDDFSHRVVESAGDTAELELTFGEEKQSIQFTRVEGRWLPTELVTNWTKVRAEVEAFLGSLDSKETRAFLETIEERLDEVLEDLRTLEKTRGRGRFANALMKLGKKYGDQLGLLGKLPW